MSQNGMNCIAWPGLEPPSRYYFLAYQTGFSAIFTGARKSRALNDVMSFRRYE